MVAVAVTWIVLWCIGVWFWISRILGRWPWLLERYTVIFPLLLVIALLVVRRWAPARSYVVAAVASGAGAGLIVGLISFSFAQMITAEERAVYWNGVRLAGAGQFLLIQLSYALSVTLGWLYGASAAAVALFADRTARRFQRSSRRKAGALADRKPLE